MHRAGQRCFPGVDHEGRQTFRLHVDVSETLIFALNKFSLNARHEPQIKMTVPYGVFFLILQIY